MSGKHFLFVYGTLRSACDNVHAQFLRDHSQFYGKASIPGLLIDMGNYPGLLYNVHEESLVWGELYDVRDDSLEKILHTLDLYEGCSTPENKRDEYVRRTLEVKYNGQSVEAYVYVLQFSADINRAIPGGDYIVYLSDRGVESLHDPSRKTKTQIVK